MRGQLDNCEFLTRDGGRTRYVNSRLEAQILICSSKSSIVPPTIVLESLTDTYFRDCHDQPYSYFVEATFRERLQAGILPDFLLLAFVATAARYSKIPFLEDCREQAIENYARTAWDIILRQAFSSEQGLNLYVVQATNLLAVIDFTGNFA